MQVGGSGQGRVEPPTFRFQARLSSGRYAPAWRAYKQSLAFTSTEVVYGVTGTGVINVPEYGVSP